MPISIRSRFVLCVALSVLSAGASIARSAPPSVDHLKQEVEDLQQAVEREERNFHAAQAALSLARCRTLLPKREADLKQAVKQKERDFHAAQARLSLARVGLARAQGKTDVEACRTLLREYEAQWEYLEGGVSEGWICCTVETLRLTEGRVAVARAWLADAENDEKTLRTELPKAIAYYELRIQWFMELREAKVLSDEDAAKLVKESETDLQWARDRLCRISSKADSDKP